MEKGVFSAMQVTHTKTQYAFSFLQLKGGLEYGRALIGYSKPHYCVCVFVLPLFLAHNVDLRIGFPIIFDSVII